MGCSPGYQGTHSHMASGGTLKQDSTTEAYRSHILQRETSELEASVIDKLSVLQYWSLSGSAIAHSVSLPAGNLSWLEHQQYLLVILNICFFP